MTRLDQEATGDQIAVLLGRPPSPRLVEQVYDTVSGQPVLQRAAGTSRRPRLLRAARRPARRAQPGAAGRLAGAVGPSAGDRPDPCHRRPARPTCGRWRPSPRSSTSPNAGAVREAVDAGVVVLGGEGVWFRHPLLADVLAETYLPGEAAPVHAAWAAHLESVSTDGVDELRRLGDLASHHERAGDCSAAFAALLQGADLRRGALRASRGRRPAGPRGRPVGGRCRRRRHRRPRAAARAGRAGPASRSGASETAYRLFRAARDLVSPERDPLWASRLAAEVAVLGFGLGDTRELPLAEFERVVELSARRARQSVSTPRPSARHAFLLYWRRAETRGRSGSRGGRGGRGSLGLRRGHQPGTLHHAPGSCWIPTCGRPTVDATVCWEQAFGVGRSLGDRRRAPHQADDLVGNEVTCAATASSARDYYEWSVPQGTTVTPEPVTWPSVAARAGRPRGGREHRAHQVWRPAGRANLEAIDPAPRGACWRRAGARTDAARGSPGPRPRDQAPPRGATQSARRARPSPRCCSPRTTQQGRSSSSSACCP